MTVFLQSVVELTARIHTYLLTLNDAFESSFTDKQLHLLIIGALGLLMVLVMHPLFLWLNKNGHTMVITFIYVLTVIIVITFAIEIGQGITGTGTMEFDDIVYGIAGFLLFFIVFAAVRAVIHLITGAGKKAVRRRHKH